MPYFGVIEEIWELNYVKFTVFLSVSGLITISVCDTLVDLKKLADQMSLLSWQNKLNRCFMFKIHVMKGG